MNGASIQPENKTRPKELLTAKEAAAFLRVGRVTVWRWCKEGVIPAYRVGRVWRIPRVGLMSFLESSNLPDDEPDANSPSPDDDPPSAPDILDNKPEPDDTPSTNNGEASAQ